VVTQPVKAAIRMVGEQKPDARAVSVRGMCKKALHFARSGASVKHPPEVAAQLDAYRNLLVVRLVKPGRDRDELGVTVMESRVERFDDCRKRHGGQHVAAADQVSAEIIGHS